LILTKPVAKDQARTTIRTAVSRVKKDDKKDDARPVQPLESAPAPVVAPTVPEARAQAAAAAASSPKPVNVTPPIEPVAPPVAKMQAATEEMIAAPPAQKVQPSAPREIPAPASQPKPAKAAPAANNAHEELTPDPVLEDLEVQHDLPTPVFSSYSEPVKKSGRGSLILLLVLILAGGAFYAAWMYQPGFREVVQPQINRALELVGMAPAQPSALVQPKPTPADPPAPKPPVAATPAATDASAASAPAADANAATPSLDSSASPVASAPTATESEPTAEEAKSENAADSKKAESKRKEVASTPPAETELPNEKNAVILSSQGAEKRLIHSVNPIYPAAARKAHVEGTVVLKAVIGENGRIEGVRVVEGDATLAVAAKTAVKQWRYRPYTRNGKTLPFQTIVLVEFQRP
jgi:protein TonB